MTSTVQERLYPLEPPSPQAVPLSLLDAATANFAATSAIWLFERPAVDSPNLVDHLRQSLRVVLGSYPHWCGFLKPVTSIDGSVGDEASGFPPHARRFGRLYAHYGTVDDPGVDFSVAESPMTLDSICPATRPALWNRDEKPLTGLLSPAALARPLAPNPPDENGKRKALLCIQVTLLACGGVALAAKSAHPLADITALISFVKDWASASRALVPLKARTYRPAQLNDMALGDIDADFPDETIVRRAHGLPFHRYDWWRPSPGSPFPSSVPEQFKDADLPPMGTAMPWAEWDVKKPVSHYTVHLNKAQVDRLYEQASSGSSARISRHDAVLAHVWSCIARARRLDRDQGPIHCDLTYGVRPALGLDEDYLGSPVVLINIELPGDVVSGRTLPLVAQQIRKSVVEMSNADKIKAHLHAAAFEKSPQRLWQAFLGRRHIIVTTWARAGLYNVDFGFGSRIRYADGIMPGSDGVVLIKEAQGSASGVWTEHGVDVCMQLCTEDMERLLKDDLLLPG